MLSSFFIQTLAMSGVVITLLIVAALIVLALLWVMGAYNGLVKLRNRYKNAFAQIDVQLKRRHDVVGNLVETVKGYSKHERETLESVTAARAQAQTVRSQGDPGAASQAEGALGGGKLGPAAVDAAGRAKCAYQNGEASCQAWSTVLS